MKRLLTFASLLFLAACGSGGSGKDLNGDGIDDPSNPLVTDTVTAVAPSSPKGRVSGRVLDMKGVAIAGAEITVTSTDPTASVATSDGSGYFFVDKITGGSTVGVYVKKSGYAPAWTSATVPGSTGNFPLNDGEAFVGNVVLLPVTAENAVTFNVVGYDGAPIDGAATLDVTPGYVLNTSGYNVGYGSIAVSGTVGGGTLSFGNVPAPADVAWMSTSGIDVIYTVYVNPIYDAASGGYGGRIFTVYAKDLLTDPWTRTLVLPAPTDSRALKIVATNVYNLVSAPSPATENLIAKGTPIYVAFNQPIAADYYVEIRDDETDVTLSSVIGIAAPTVNALGTEMQISPKGTTGFVDGKKYNLLIQVSPRDNPAGGTVTFSGPFFGGDIDAPKPLGTPDVNLISAGIDNDTWDVGEKLEIVFDKYIGRADGTMGTTQILPVYFDVDLDNSGETGDLKGEAGSNEPLCVRASEGVPGWLTSAKASGYSSKFTLTPADLPAYATLLDANDIAITIAFNESFKCPGGAMSSVWGEALSTEVPAADVNVVPVP